MTHVAVRLDAGSETRWLMIGGQFGEYRVTSYDPIKDVLTLSHGETKLELNLKTSAVQPRPMIELLQALVQAGDTELARALKETSELDTRRKKTAVEVAELEARASNDPKL